MKLIFALSLLAFGLVTQAAEVKVATISTNVDKDVTIFYLDVNTHGELDGMRYITTAGSGQITEDFYFTLAQVEATGAVVEERNGYDVVKLFIEDFTPRDGGIIRLNYLVNGARRFKKDMRLKLVKKEAGFLITDFEGNNVNQLYFVGNYIRILGLVGIREIRTSYTAE